MPKPTRENTIADISDLVTRPTRACTQESLNLTIDTHQNKNLKLVDHDNNTKIRALFTNMKRGAVSINFAEYLNIAHEQATQNKCEDKANYDQINLSDFIPGPKTINQDLKSSSFIKEKWGAAI